MENKEKALEISKNWLSGDNRLSSYDSAIKMAEFKDKQWEEKLINLLYETFYIHPHDCRLVCTESFVFDYECGMDSFVESFIKRLSETEA